MSMITLTHDQAFKKNASVVCECKDTNFFFPHQIFDPIFLPQALNHKQTSEIRLKFRQSQTDGEEGDDRDEVFAQGYPVPPFYYFLFSNDEGYSGANECAEGVRKR